MITNHRLAGLIRPHYACNQIDGIISLLQEKGTLTFPALPNGLFPAAVVGKNKSYTGYSNVWVRDNICIAYAHDAVGNVAVATKTVGAIMEYFSRHRNRFVNIINGTADPANPMNRPHIRFDGSTLDEKDEKWPHAQNDALGYFLWMFSKLASEGKIAPSPKDFATLDLFPRYFEAIRYWQDEDSGHWEETRKISASSVGVVMADLREFGKLRDAQGTRLPVEHAALRAVEALIARGRATLESILPAECVQPDPAQWRPYDAALLFLIYPLAVVDETMADRILDRTRLHLQGEYGIRRYLGDSYWAPDYKKKLVPDQRTRDFSDDLSSRDQLLSGEGQEAQWCIFDPIISCIYGARFSVTAAGADLARQTEYLNRSLAQITSEDKGDVPPFRCPELYYLEDGSYVPNDHVPLLWTQANLMLSLKTMKDSLQGRP